MRPQDLSFYDTHSLVPRQSPLSFSTYMHVGKLRGAWVIYMHVKVIITCMHGIIKICLRLY